MKKSNWVKPVAGVVAVTVLIIIVGTVIMTLYNKYVWPREVLQNWSDESNYVTAVGTIEEITYGREIYIVIVDESPSISFNHFVVPPENAKILIENGFQDRVKVGDQIEFASPTEYFGGGDIPIAAITVGGITYLDYEVGFANVYNWLQYLYGDAEQPLSTSGENLPIPPKKK